MIHYHIANEMNAIKVSLIQIPLMYGSRPMNMKTDTPALLFQCLIMKINEVMFILMCALVHVPGILISMRTIKKQCRKHARDVDFTWIQKTTLYEKFLHGKRKRKENTIDSAFVHKIFYILFSKGGTMVYLFSLEYQSLEFVHLDSWPPC